MKKLFLTLTFAFAAMSAHAAVDLNTASQAELEAVNGIGPKKAQAIIEFRQKHGPFKTVADLDKVPGFGKATVDKVKDSITVGNVKAASSGKTADAKMVAEKPAKK